MTQKYYTPQIEEFHIGMEFEEEFKNPNHKKMVRPIEDKYEWVKLKLDTSHSMSRIISKIKQNRVRVKYIDRADLIELGWVKFGKFLRFDMEWCFWKVYLLDDGISLHHIGKCGWDSDFELENCNVKNKTEMKKLMEMLNIKPPKQN